MSQFLKLIALAFLMTACQHKEQSLFFSTYKEGENEIRVFRLDSYTDTIPLKLTDIAEDIKIIKLETIDSSLVSTFNVFINDQYIVSQDFYNILLFNRDGKYLKNLSRSGRGPGEFNNLRQIVLSDRGNKLYGLEFSPEKIHCWNLNDNDYKGIHTGTEGVSNDIMVVEDSLIFVSNMRYDICKDKLLVINPEGKILNRIPNTSNEDSKHSMGRKILYHIDGNSYYYPHWCDSIYQIMQDTLMLKYAFPGHQKEQIYIENITSDFLICSSFTPRKEVPKTIKDPVTGEESHATYTYGDSYRYIIYPKQHKVICFTKLQNDIMSDRINSEYSPTMMGFVGDKIIYYYPALQLTTRLPEILKDSTLDNDIRQRLQEVLNGLHEDDNPVLVVGKLKKQNDIGKQLW